MKLTFALFSNFLYILRAKWVWKKPKKSMVLLYDRAGADLFFYYLDSEHVEVLDVRGESLNIPILIRAFLLNGGKYRDLYIKLVQPRVVLTFIDNSLAFCSLKTREMQFVTVFVQNGLRGEPFDILGVFKNNASLKSLYTVDYMCVFNSLIGREYSKYVNGNVIVTGSFKNNLMNISDKHLKKSILFISQYRKPTSNSEKFMQCENYAVSWDAFYAAERMVLPFLALYAKQQGYTLYIVAASKKDEDREYLFYAKILSAYNWQFLPQKNEFSGYMNVDTADYVAFIDSTLGYEALARKKRIAAFSIRNVCASLESRVFGWPANLPSKGPFWTNQSNEAEFMEIMNYITTVSDQKWDEIVEQYMPLIMEYDPGNKRFIELMQNLNIPLKQEYKKIEGLMN